MHVSADGGGILLDADGRRQLCAGGAMVLGVAAACCGCTCAPGDDTSSADLVVNGGFEADAGTTVPNVNVAPSGWTVVSGVPCVLHPDADPFAFSGDGYPLPPEGSQFLSGGFNPGSPTPAANDLSVCEQEVDVSGYSAAIDAGRGCFYCRATLGTYGDGGSTPQNDRPTVEFLVGGVAAVTFGPALGDFFGFRDPSEASGLLPVGTRVVTVRITMTKDATAPAGYSNDAYVDDVRFHICAAEDGS
jgi:hypothetical protein